MTNLAQNYHFFATTPKGLELLLVDELRELGATNPAEKLAGVSFTGDIELAYKACLWSRLANRILLRLAQVPAATPEELYAGVQNIPWFEHINPEGTINVNFVTSHSNITHTLFGAQKVKDAIVDQLRNQFSTRPTVVKENPDVSIHVYLQKNVASISLDLSGESLHKRGYRLEHGAAPLKENLAAAILIRSGWKKRPDPLYTLMDPMCGSGTLLIEAALMAGDIAPGLLHDYFGFLGWKKHSAALWSKLLEEAKVRREKGISQIPTIVGYDINPYAIKIAFANIDRAGLTGRVHVEKRDITASVPKQSNGLLVTNPPYGERLGELPDLKKLYEKLGIVLKKEFVGWQAAVFTGNPDLGKTMGLRAVKQYALFNGAIPCQLLLFDVQPEHFVDRSPEANNERRIRRAQKSLTDLERESAQMFANRLGKNIKKIKSWAERENVSCYRVYDADLPEYAVAIDRYGSYVAVQEYPAPKTVDPKKAERRLQQILAVLPEASGTEAKQIFFRHPDQEINDIDDLLLVEEQGIKYLINLISAKVGIGLALEQRDLRALIRQEAKGKHFLNLFARSGAMTVNAALGGALTTQSICADDFYLAWINQNLMLNQLNGQCVKANSPEWLEVNRHHKAKYDLIYAELPQSTFHLREEHPDLIEKIMSLVTPAGKLYLITVDPRFKINPEIMTHYSIEDISQKLLPKDFERSKRIQQCWVLQHPNT